MPMKKKLKNHELVKRRIKLEDQLNDTRLKLSLNDRKLMEDELDEVLKAIADRRIQLSEKLITGWWSKHGTGIGRLCWKPGRKDEIWPEGAIAACKSPNQGIRYYYDKDSILRHL